MKEIKEEWMLWQRGRLECNWCLLGFLWRIQIKASLEACRKLHGSALKCFCPHWRAPGHFQSLFYLLFLRAEVFPRPGWVNRRIQFRNKHPEQVDSAGMLSRVSPSVSLHFQVVSRASLWERSWETLDRERKTWELPGEGEPEPPWGLCPFSEDGGWQRREQRWQIQSDTRHDPLPGRKSRESMGQELWIQSPFSWDCCRSSLWSKWLLWWHQNSSIFWGLLGWLAPVRVFWLKSHFAVLREPLQSPGWILSKEEWLDKWRSIHRCLSPVSSGSYTW